MKEKITSKQFITLAILLVVALLSFFLVSKIASSPNTYKSTIEYLDGKKLTVAGITGAAAGTSVALSAIPGDSTNAIANQIMQVSSYLVIVVAAVTLEKFLLTVAGYISFKLLIPLACLLLGIYLFTDRKALKSISLKLIAFALILVMIVPLSVELSKLLDETYDLSLEQNTLEFQELEKDASLLEKIGNATSGLLKKAESLLSGFIDSIAVLIITCCVIPILIFILLFQMMKILFHINITIPDIKRIKSKEAEKKEELEIAD